ncbi:MAG: hypothetical protein ABIQ02_10780 [Saprospiraceae bacterium]
MIRSLTLIVLIALTGTFSACTYDNQEDIGCTGVPESISFSADVLPIFRSSCSTVSCHSGVEPTGNLNLENGVAYEQLTRVGSGYINTDFPNHSKLYTQLNSLALPMPPAGKLDQCSIDYILKWIEQGALNN